MTESFDARFDRIVDDLDVDAELEALDLSLDELELELAELEVPLGETLVDVLEPPPGFTGRVAERALRNVHRRQTIEAFAGLFTLGWRTARTVVEGDDDVDER